MFFSAVHPLYLLADEIHSPRAVHPLHSMNSHIVWLYAAFGGSSTSLHAIVACMGMTANDLLQRLRACETVLADCDVGTHGLLSKGQSDIVLAMMSQTTISSDDVGPVTEQVLKFRWADPSQKAALLKMVGSLTRSARPRAKLQDFETLAMFIAEQMWAVLLNDEVDYHSKAALLCDHAVALQLRHPTEPTVGCMIALLLLCTEGPVKARSTSPEYQHDLFVSLKNMLKKRSNIPPVAIIDKLGSDPALFMVQHPDIFAAVFARGGPVRPNVTMAEITVISNSTNLRNRKGGARRPWIRLPVAAAAVVATPSKR